MSKQTSIHVSGYILGMYICIHTLVYIYIYIYILVYIYSSIIYVLVYIYAHLYSSSLVSIYLWGTNKQFCFGYDFKLLAKWSVKRHRLCWVRSPVLHWWRCWHPSPWPWPESLALMPSTPCLKPAMLGQVWQPAGSQLSQLQQFSSDSMNMMNPFETTNHMVYIYNYIIIYIYL